MIDTIYIEESIAGHPRTKEILLRFPQATPISCSNYKEIFNPSGQNFRLQKKKPSLILAEKTGHLALPIPETYGIGGKRNFYFSHMLNCLYDCRYCFLQGMYPSAHYVLFVNYENFLSDIEAKTMEDTTQPTWFFSGYDCDSLVLDGISQFVKSFLPFFKTNHNAHLELRTKSVNIKPLLENEPLENVVTAFSFHSRGDQFPIGTWSPLGKFAHSSNEKTNRSRLAGWTTDRSHSLTAKISQPVTKISFKIYSLRFPVRKFIRSPWAPFECPLPFSKKWKNFIPRKNSFPVGSKIDPVPLHTVRKSSGKEKKPVFNYYYNTFLPKRFLIAKSLLAPTPKKNGITIRLHFIKIFSI